VPRSHFRVLAAAACGRAGVPVTFVGGNPTSGPTQSGEEISCRVRRVRSGIGEGRHLFLAHGDQLMAGDRGYLFLNHYPSLAIAATAGSTPISGFRWRKCAALAQSPRRDALRRRSCANGSPCRASPEVEAVVLGHFHVPTLITSEGRDFVVLGDWIGGMLTPYWKMAVPSLPLAGWTP
jgi:UDP-2,3-diacylglucosamine pyrophosphatase LpxH